MFFAHESTIDGFCKVFIMYFFQVSLEKNNLYLTFKYMSVVFLFIHCYYKYTVKNDDDNGPGEIKGKNSPSYEQETK